MKRGQAPQLTSNINRQGFRVCIGGLNDGSDDTCKKHQARIYLDKGHMDSCIPLTLICNLAFPNFLSIEYCQVIQIQGDQRKSVSTFSYSELPDILGLLRGPWWNRWLLVRTMI
ncbi:hypothetical protein SCA6_020355 [Theobroma cacao]